MCRGFLQATRRLNSLLRTKTHLYRVPNGKEYISRSNDIVLRVARRSESKVFLNSCKPKPRHVTLDKFRIDFPVCGVEISLVQPNVSLIKLAFSSRGTSMLCLIFSFSADGKQHAKCMDSKNIVLISLISKSHDLYVVQL